MTATMNEKSNLFGVVAMAIAAIALTASVIHMTAGPFERQPAVEDTIVDVAVRIRDAAQRAASGEPAPQPEPAKFDIDQAIKIGSLGLASLAMTLGIIAIARREERAPAFVGFSLGGAVLLVAWLQWIALMICAAMIIGAIIYNFSDILSV